MHLLGSTEPNPKKEKTIGLRVSADIWERLHAVAIRNFRTDRDQARMFIAAGLERAEHQVSKNINEQNRELLRAVEKRDEEKSA